MNISKSTLNPPFIPHFKNDDAKTATAKREDLQSLWKLEDKLKALGHYHKEYDNVEHLKRQFCEQLDKL